MSEHNDRDTFFAVLKEIEQLGTNCANKRKFLDNVLTAKETITFAVIDRCREAVLQLRQANHVVQTLHDKVRNTPLAEEHQERLQTLLKAAQEDSTQATQALDEIIGWVPAAVNTRSIGPGVRQT
jgi:hypothetical protein